MQAAALQAAALLRQTLARNITHQPQAARPVMAGWRAPASIAPLEEAACAEARARLWFQDETSRAAKSRPCASERARNTRSFFCGVFGSVQCVCCRNPPQCKLVWGHQVAKSTAETASHHALRLRQERSPDPGPCMQRAPAPRPRESREESTRKVRGGGGHAVGVDELDGQ